MNEAADIVFEQSHGEFLSVDWPFFQPSKFYLQVVEKLAVLALKKVRAVDPMRFKHRVRQKRIPARDGDMTDSIEWRDRLVLGGVPASGFQPVGHALGAFDQKMVSILRSVGRRAKAREAGRLKAVPLNRLEGDGQEQPADLVEFTEIKHVAYLSWDRVEGREWSYISKRFDD